MSYSNILEITSIFLVFLNLVSIFFLINIYIKYNKMVIENKIIKSQNDENNFLINKQSKEILENIKNIERLSSENNFLKQKSNDIEHIYNKMSSEAKSVFIDISSNLTKELYEKNKKDSQYLEERTNNIIKNSSTSFNNELERVIKMVGSIAKQIDISQNNVDLLKNSLLSPAKAGYLAEITLENLLKASGLRNEIDYHLQYHTKSEDTIYRPDAVIYLPNNNIMVVDAKTSVYFINESDLKHNKESIRNLLIAI
ncbi:MAG TPA: DNA recombination protein RmuC [Candidatus Megaira endosymbiont of Hartmannula sinica]|nr:DNA recombination protein RmuC [Candidatus Megaera endosymbiont of Hartmannula sinica]